MAFPYLPAVASSLGDPMTLAKLVQQAQPSQLQQAQPVAPPVGAAPPDGRVVTPADAPAPEQEIAVTAQPPSQYTPQSGQGLLGLLFPKTFRLGSAAGNFTGSLRDDLTGTHNYAAALQNAREGEALQSFEADPQAAIAAMRKVNPQLADQMQQRLFENGLKTNEDTRQNTELDQTGQVRNAQIRQAGLQTDNMVRDRVSAMLLNANEQTFPALLAKAKAYAAQYNVAMPFPADWREASQWAREGIPAGTQVELGNQRDYQQGQLQIGRASAAARNTQAQAAVTRANRPPTPRNQTTGDVIATIMRIPPEQRTPEQKRQLQVYEQRGQPRGKSTSPYTIGPGGKLVLTPTH